MDLHQKEQLHDNAMSKMHSQNFSVSFNCFETTKMFYRDRVVYVWILQIGRYLDLVVSTWGEHIHHIVHSNSHNILHLVGYKVLA